MAKEVTFPVGYHNLDKFMSNVVSLRFPGVKVYDKSSSALMWALYVIGFMWIWNKGFMTRFHTAVGTSVYITRRSIEGKRWNGIYRTMRHEFMHLLQREKHGLKYDLSYLFPQILSVFSLTALFAIWFSNAWLFGLVFLAMLLPWPAPWRAKWEFEGYTQTMLVSYEETGKIPQSRIESIIRNFTGPFYYFMFPFKSYVTKRINDIATKIRSGKIRSFFLDY